LRDHIARREISPVEVTRRALDTAQATQASLNVTSLGRAMADADVVRLAAAYERSQPKGYNVRVFAA
jgi:hypothetical protein